MAMQDSKALTPEEVLAAKARGFHQACLDVEPILHYCKAADRKITEADLHKSVADLVYECLTQTRQEFDPDAD